MPLNQFNKPKQISPLLTRGEFLPRLIGSAVLFNFLVFVLVGLLILEGYRHAQQRSEISTQNLTQILESEIAGHIDAADLILSAAMDEYQRQRSSGRINGLALNTYIERIHSRQPGIDALRITDAQGVLIYGTGVIPSEKVSIADRPHFIRLRDDPHAGLLISKPQVSRVNQKWVVVLARRIREPNGSFGGMAFAVITLDHLAKIISTINVGPHGVVALRDENLGLIARHPQPRGVDNYIGNNLLAKEIRGMIVAGETIGTVTARSILDNVERNYSYRKFGAYPLYILVGLATEDYLASWRNEAIALAALAAIFVLITVIVSCLAYRSWNRRDNLVKVIQKSENLFHNYFELGQVGMAITSIDKGWLDVNQCLCEMLGYTKEELVKMTWVELTYPDDIEPDTVQFNRVFSGEIERYSMDKRFIHKNKKIVHTHVNVACQRKPDKSVEYIMASVLNITERKQLENKILQLAFNDALTGLPNRRLLEDRLNQIMAANKRSGEYGALMFVDLDDFKRLNDTHGHAFGDLLLIEVADRLRSCVREADTILRFGGDEFLVIISELDMNKAKSTSQAGVV